jgi:hypothetical protein
VSTNRTGGRATRRRILQYFFVLGINMERAIISPLLLGSGYFSGPLAATSGLGTSITSYG